MIQELARSLSIISSLEASLLEKLRAFEEFSKSICKLDDYSVQRDVASLRTICTDLWSVLNKTFSDVEELSTTELSYLKAWPGLLMSYIEAPSGVLAFDVLLTNIRSADRNNALGENDLANIETYLQSRAELRESEQSSEFDSIGSNADQEIGFIHTLQAGISTFSSIIASLPPASAALHDVHENYRLSILQLKAISSLARDCGFLGLMEVCLGVCDVLQTWVNQPKDQREFEYTYLTELPTLLNNYIRDRNDPEAGRAFTHFVYQADAMPWLSDDDRTILNDFILRDFDVVPAMQTEQLKGNADDDLWIMQVSTPVDHAFEMSIECLPQMAAELMGSQHEGSLDDLTSTAAFSREEQELADILCAELHEIDQAKGLLLELASTSGCEASARADALDRYAASAGHIANAAEMVGLDGLHQAARFVSQNINEFKQAGQLITDTERELLEMWPDTFHLYLKDMHASVSSHALADMLANPHWLLPMESDEIVSLVSSLQHSSIKVGDDRQPRQLKAHVADVSLTLPDDVNPELLDGMLQELPNQTGEFSAAIQSVLENNNIGEIETAQRIAHTLKGAANVVGIKGIANLTHHLEDILEGFAKQRQLPSGAVADTLLNAADCLEMMSEALLGRGKPPEDALQVMQDVLDWANYLDKEGVPQQQMAGRPQAAEILNGTANEDPQQIEPALSGEELAGLAKEADNSNAENVEPALRVPTSLADELLRLTGENMIATGQTQEHVRQLYTNLHALGEHNKSLQQLAFDLELLLDVRGVASRLYRQAGGGEFDSLEMDQYNELHTFSRKLIESASDSFELTARLYDNLSNLEQLGYHQERLNQDSRNILLRTRMISVSTIVPRMKRALRQACRMTDKKAKLVVKGSDTLMDSSVLNELLDPLMHLLRNAVDHGIEAEGIRLVQNKPATGIVEIVFSSTGQQITVSCEDDGNGLDYESIRAKALERGFINPADAVSDEQLNRLILQSGFSTRREVTQTSGRGIGLDVVSTRVRRMKGTLQVQSEQHKGTCIILNLPTSILASNSLLIRIGEDTVAVSCRGIEELISTSAGELIDEGGETLFRVADASYPVTYLDRQLNIMADQHLSERSCLAALLVRNGENKVAVVVEEIIASRNVVVKSLGRYVPRVRGVIGATILGDGSVAPVIDILEALQTTLPSTQDWASESSDEYDIIEEAPYVLVVDDSLSARRSLEQFIADTGLDVKSARDGVDALEVMRERLPDIFLVDLEMPRMNGLELTAHIRANEATRHIPVIMITSRSTDKHKTQAKAAGVNQYLVKPFSEDELMSAIQTLLQEAS